MLCGKKIGTWFVRPWSQMSKLQQDVLHMADSDAASDTMCLWVMHFLCPSVTFKTGFSFIIIIVFSAVLLKTEMVYTPSKHISVMMHAQLQNHVLRINFLSPDIAQLYHVKLLCISNLRVVYKIKSPCL